LSSCKKVLPLQAQNEQIRMFERKDYIVHIGKLKKGENFYSLLVSKELFESFDYKEVKDITCKVDIRMVKQERLIEFYFTFKGEVTLVCSRCLSDLILPINKHTQLYVRFDEQYSEYNVNEIIISENRNEIDIFSYVYEELRLELPISPSHSRTEECDKEMINLLLVKNTESQNKEEDFDPRWAKLKEFKNKIKT